MVSGESSSKGKAPKGDGNRKPFPKHFEYDTKITDSTSYDSSSSDYSTTGYGEHVGGVSLKASPYRPPHVREAKAKAKKAAPMLSPDSITDPDSPMAAPMLSPDSITDPDSPMVAKFGKLSFQQGKPAEEDIFTSTEESTSSDEPEVKPVSRAVRGVAAKKATAVPKAVPRAVPAVVRPLVAEPAKALPSGPVYASASIPSSQSGTLKGALVRKQQSNRHLVGDKDAQSVYGHTSCVFVANLPAENEDEALEAALTRNFAKFGTVFIKVKRDNRGMPFAFCQYTNEQHAAEAISHGQGLSILGRACRVEPAKANRAFIFCGREGKIIGLSEAKAIAIQFGSVARCEPLDDQIKAKLGFASAVFVEFVHFDCERDLVGRFTNHPTIKVVQYDPERLFRNVDNDQAFLEEYAQDRKSVFVGNLPHGVTEKDIENVFESSGDIVSIRIVARNLGSFAFVQFGREDMADFAVRHWHGAQMLGSTLRVERKITKDKVPRRINSAYVREVTQTPRRVVTAAPGSTPFVRRSGQNTPGVQMPGQPTPRGQFPSRRTSMAYMSAATKKATPSTVITPATHAAVFSPAIPAINAGSNAATPGGSLQVPAQQRLQMLTPPFGPHGFFQPTAQLMPANAFPGNVVLPDGRGQPTIAQDPVNGNWYICTPISAPVHAAVIHGQRSVSSTPHGSASQSLGRTSQGSLKSKKSVTFADPVVQPSPEHNEKGRLA